MLRSIPELGPSLLRPRLCWRCFGSHLRKGRFGDRRRLLYGDGRLSGEQTGAYFSRLAPLGPSNPASVKKVQSPAG